MPVFPGSPVKVSGYPFMGREVFSPQAGKKDKFIFKKLKTFLKDELVFFQPDGIVPES